MASGAVTWQGDERTTTAEWKRTRKRILRRDAGICHVCKRPGADEVDHLVPRGEGGSEDDSNLAPIHRRPCHAQKSSAEGTRARWARYPRRRPADPHPGIVDRGAG